MSTARESRAVPRWLLGGGEMGELIRAIDWAKTPIGPPETWPPALRTMLSVLLTSQHPMFIYWGPQLVQFYNDAYRPILGSKKHPAAMGQPGKPFWVEVWDILEPMMNEAWRGGATYVKDGMLVLDRHGFLEECYFDYAYTPIRDETGEVAGIFVPCGETTGRILGERRLATLGELSASLAGARDPLAACQHAARVLSTARSDVPFALLYLADDDPPTKARLTACAGLSPGQPAAPEEVLLDDDAAAWPLGRARRAEIDVMLASRSRLGVLPGGSWPEPASVAVIHPLLRTDGRPLGWLVAGISPRLTLDEAYRAFLRLVAGHVASGVQNARAHADERTRADKLAALDRAKTAFFSNVSHELRTPLTLVLGPTERLLTAPDLPEGYRRELTVIARNARTLLKHVDDLLDVARIEAGKTTARYAEVDLAHAVRLAAGHFEIVAEEKRIAFRVEAAGPLVGQIDAEKFQRVVLNLLSNAFKFTPPGGQIRCTLSRDGVHDAAVLEVADSGPGIRAEERDVVFERFRQLDGGATRRFGGTGLGLAITREFVDLHRGTIDVGTAPEGGASFSVRLPLRAPEGTSVAGSAFGESDAGEVARRAVEQVRERAPAPAAPAAPVDASDASGTVLVVEDNPEMNEFIRQSLPSGCRALAAYDGEEGLRAALEEPPDLIITDVMMPKLSGDALLRAIRAHRELDGVPVVVVTARADEEARVELLRDGAQDFLTKPFSADELRARTKNLISMKRARDTLQRELSSHTDDIAALSQEITAHRRELESALTRLRAQEETQRFLATATAMLAESLDYKKTLARVASLAVPTLADWCVLDLLEEDRRIRRAEVAHADPGHAALAARLMRLSVAPDNNPAHPGTRVLLTGAPVLIEEVTDADRRAMAENDAHLELVRALGLESIIAVPLVAHGRTLGILTLASAQSRRRYGQLDVVVAQDMGRRCALAMDNARLFADAQAAIVARDEFLNIASHELRTPLTPLQIQLHTLGRHVDEFAKRDKHEWIVERLRRIQRQSRRLDRLVSELLELSRIVGGRLHLEFEDVDLGEVVSAIVTDLRDHGELAHSRSELRLHRQAEATGRWDRARVGQVVSSLLSNALKFGADKPIDVTVRADEAWVMLEVRDRGNGIAPEDQQRIFDRFERAVSVWNYGGFGLGLYLARQLVIAMGGSIQLDSRRGEGSTFAVALPRSGAELRRDPPVEAGQRSVIASR